MTNDRYGHCSQMLVRNGETEAKVLAQARELASNIRVESFKTTKKRRKTTLGDHAAETAETETAEKPPETTPLVPVSGPQG